MKFSFSGFHQLQKALSQKIFWKMEFHKLKIIRVLIHM